MAVGVLDLGGDGVPGRDLVGLEQALGLGRGAEQKPTSITSGACGPLLSLLALIAWISSPGASVRVELVDLEAMLGL